MCFLFRIFFLFLLLTKASFGELSLNALLSDHRESGKIQSPRPHFDEYLDLPTLIDIALENNPRTRQSWIASKVALAKLGQAKSGFYPTLSAVFSAQEQRQLSVTTQSYGPALQINYTLFDFGARKENAQAAREALHQAQYSFNRTIQEVVYNVEAAYYKLYTAEATVQADQRSLEDANANYVLAEKRKQSGLSNIQDLLQSQANRNGAEYTLARDRAQIENARAQLAQVLGIQVNNTLKIAPPDFEEARKLDSMQATIQELTEASLESRPDVLAASSNLNSNAAKLKASQRTFWPQIVVNGEGGYSKINHQSDYQKNYQGTIALQWDFFKGFNDYYRIREARENRNIALEQIKSIEVELVSNIWASYYGYQSATEQLKAAHSFLKSAQESFQAIEKGYKNGLENILNLIASQKILAEARLQVIQSENNLALSLAELSFATGQFSTQSFYKSRYLQSL